MKFIKIAVAALFVSGLAASAQTNSPTPPGNFFGALGTEASALYTAGDKIGLLDATNYAPVAYATYAPKAKDHWGGGAAVAFDFPALNGTNGTIGTLFGYDWLGHWSMVNANVTLKAKFKPLAGYSSLPNAIQQLQFEPIAIVGVWTSSSGSSQGGTLWDLGADISYGHLWGGQFCSGFTYGEWNGDTVEGGHRYRIFTGWRYGF